MPPKTKTTKASSKSRSRSVSRSRSASRTTRSKSRSQSRGRVTKKAQKVRTPVSESKIVRKRSPSPSTSESEVSLKVIRRKSSAAVIPILTKSATPIRVSRRVIERVESSNVESKSDSGSSRSSSSSNATKLTTCSQSCRILKSIASKVGGFVCSEGTHAFIAMLVLPFSVFWLNLFVHKSNIPITKKGHSWAGVTWPTDWRLYINPYIVVGVCGYLLMHAVITSIPIGRKLPVLAGGRRHDYRANGILSLLFFGLMFGVCQVYGKKHLAGFTPSKVADHWLALMTTALMLSFLIACYSYVRGRYARRPALSPGSKVGNVFADFYNGRELRPYWFNVDMKMFLFRPSICLLLLVEATLCAKQFESIGKISPALATIVVFHLVYAIDYLVYEPTMLSSYEMAYAGFGFLRIMADLLIIPFAYTIGVSYLFQHPQVGFSKPNMEGCNAALLGIATALRLLGQWVARSSNNQKYLFRRDPQHPSLSAVHTVPTSTGKRLLAGGWWGIVRHPNYLGEILMAIGAALPAGLATPIMWIHPVFILVFMSLRAHETDRRSASKYGAGWVNYKRLVPCRLIPRVY